MKKKIKKTKEPKLSKSELGIIHRKIRVFNRMIYILVGIVIIILTSQIIDFTYNKIILPAKYSVINACLPADQSQALINNSGYQVSGSTTSKTNADGSKNITVKIYTENAELIPKITKHEQCHTHQILRGDNITCSNIKSMYFAEYECYLMQNLPNKIFNWFYD